jgi:ATP-binding cassette subfamily B protein
MGIPQTLHATLPGFGRIVRRFWPHIRTQRSLITGSLLALVAEVGLRLLEPWPLKFVFDHIFASAPLGDLLTRFAVPARSPLALLTFATVAMVTVTGLRALADYVNTIGFALVGNRVLAEVRAELYCHLQCLSLAFHDRARNGDLTARLSTDISVLTDVTVTALLPLLGNMLVMLGMIGVMLWLNWQLTLIAVATLPLFWFATVHLGWRIREASRLQRQREGALAATVAESIGAIKIVQALSLERLFAQTFANHNTRSLREGVQAARLAAGLERRVDVLVVLASALVLWYGAWLVLGRGLTPGELLVFLSYLKSTFKPVQDFAKYMGRLAKATAAGERVIDLLDREPEVRDSPRAVRAHRFQGSVKFEGVSFAYEPGHPVLEEITFEAIPGRCIALVGASGNGKSTLINLILRLYDPTQGQVMIDWLDIRRYKLAALRAQISVVLQDTILFAASLYDNIAYGAPNPTPEAIEAAARLANAHTFIERLPQGYDTVLGERGVTLSGGQRQRIGIARAAIRQAPILILDEPTSGLDEENSRAVIEALSRLAAGRTTFLIAHDLQLASTAHLILFIENGRIIERGRHSQLMRANGRYAGLYRLQWSTRAHAMKGDERIARANGT